MDNQQYDDQIPEEIAPKMRDTSFAKRAGKRVWEAIRSLPGEFLNFWKSYPLKARKIAAILAAVVLVAGVVGTLVFPDYTDCVFYLKDGELYVATADGHTRRITEKLIRSGAPDGSKDRELSWRMDDFVQLSEDGRSLFYADNVSVRSKTWDTVYPAKYDLYWTDLTNPWQKPVKIASGLKTGWPIEKQYIVDHKAHRVIYQLGNTLHQYDRSGTSAVATDVMQVKFSDDQSSVAYFTDKKQDGTATLYIKRGGKAPVKIGEGISLSSGMTFFNEDMSAVAFRKKDGLFFKSGKNAPFAISADSAVIGGITGKNTMYYYTLEEQKVSQLQLIDDDWNGESYGGYSHDEIIQMLKKATFSKTFYTLWYYNGMRTVKISDTAVHSESGYEKNALGVYLYEDYGVSQNYKIKLSELIAYCEERGINTVTMGFSSMRNQILEKNARYYACFGALRTKIDLENVYSMHIQEDSKVIYAYYRRNDKYQIYKIPMLGMFPMQPELMNQEYRAAGFLMGGVHLAYDRYHEQYKEQCGTLFMNGKEVDTDVRVVLGDSFFVRILTKKPFFQYCEKTGRLYYLKQDYKLMEYNGWTSKEIRGNVSEFVLLKNGSVLMYVWDEGQRGLWLWNGIRFVKIDEGYTFLISDECFTRYEF